ncbi:MAG: hypothetical protein ACREV7_05290 [Steroidobacteraceae bacterium]
MTGQVPGEAFTTVAGPTCGTVYRGVAYVCGMLDPRSGVGHTGRF